MTVDLPNEIILGSGSPRRKELLEALGLSFSVIKRSIDESLENIDNVFKSAEVLSLKKSSVFEKEKSDGKLIITADTVVIAENQILGKPNDSYEASHMLRKLSNNKHHVVTGVCLSTVEKTICFSTQTDVTFDTITQDEIDYYIENYQPFDKAGSYGIQEWMGMAKVKSIKGCYYNVVGLPLNSLYQALRQFK